MSEEIKRPPPAPLVEAPADSILDAVRIALKGGKPVNTLPVRWAITCEEFEALQSGGAFFQTDDGEPIRNWAEWLDYQAKLEGALKTQLGKRVDARLPLVRGVITKREP